jgi:hypothetical protein
VWAARVSDVMVVPALLARKAILLRLKAMVSGTWKRATYPSASVDEIHRNACRACESQQEQYNVIEGVLSEASLVCFCTQQT